ncbi:hypothetical protein J2T16_000752 [Paenibacillus intestini]|nr:hypothetical protein [Paenibacillus intestini]
MLLCFLCSFSIFTERIKRKMMKEKGKIDLTREDGKT